MCVCVGACLCGGVWSVTVWQRPHTTTTQPPTQPPHSHTATTTQPKATQPQAAHSHPPHSHRHTPTTQPRGHTPPHSHHHHTHSHRPNSHHRKLIVPFGGFSPSHPSFLGAVASKEGSFLFSCVCVCVCMMCVCVCAFVCACVCVCVSALISQALSGYCQATSEQEACDKRGRRGRGKFSCGGMRREVVEV